MASTARDFCACSGVFHWERRPCKQIFDLEPDPSRRTTTSYPFRAKVSTSTDQNRLTWIHPLHAVGESVVRDQIVPSPSWIGDNDMCRGQRGEEEGD